MRNRKFYFALGLWWWHFNFETEDSVWDDHTHIRFLLDVTEQCQHLHVPQERSQRFQSGFTQCLRIARGRVASGFGQSCLSAHVGEHARFQRRRIETVSTPRGVLCPDIHSKKTRQVQVQVQVPRRILGCIARGAGSLSNYFLKGIRQALRDEFGEGLADQDFKFNFDEDAKRVTITIKAWSCLALNPWMTNLLHSGTFGMYGITKRRFAEWNDDFSLLGDDEYSEVDGKKPTKDLIDAIITDTPFLTYTIGEPSDKVTSWRASDMAFQTIYIYSDVVASQVVGDVRANLLRVIAPKGSHTSYRQFERGGITVFRGCPIPHVQYGRGFGSLFKSMGRMVTPLIGKTVRYAGKMGLERGIGLLSDVLSGENVKTAAKRRASAAFQQAKQDALEEVKSTVKRRRKGPSTTTTPGKKRRNKKGGQKGGQKGGRYRRRRLRTTADIFG